MSNKIKEDSKIKGEKFKWIEIEEYLTFNEFKQERMKCVQDVFIYGRCVYDAQNNKRIDPRIW